MGTYCSDPRTNLVPIDTQPCAKLVHAMTTSACYELASFYTMPLGLYYDTLGLIDLRGPSDRTVRVGTFCSDPRTNLVPIDTQQCAKLVHAMMTCSCHELASFDIMPLSLNYDSLG